MRIGKWSFAEQDRGDVVFLRRSSGDPFTLPGCVAVRSLDSGTNSMAV